MSIKNEMQEKIVQLLVDKVDELQVGHNRLEQSLSTLHNAVQSMPSFREEMLTRLIEAEKQSREYAKLLFETVGMVKAIAAKSNVNIHNIGQASGDAVIGDKK